MIDARHPALSQRDFWLDEAVWQEGEPIWLVERLIGLLRDSGIPLQRATVAVSTLHPEIVGVAYVWRRKTGSVERMVGDRAGVLSSDIYDRSPFQLAIEEGVSGFRRRIERNDCLEDLDLIDELRAEGASDYVCMVNGTFGSRGGTMTGWTTDRPGGFTTTELVAISEHARLSGHVLAAHSMRETTKNLVSTYVGRRAGARVLAGEIERGRSSYLDAAIWLSDVRDFTGLSERLRGGELLPLLDKHFDTIIKPIQAHGGEVMKLIGDAVLAVFPCDVEGGAKSACAAALAAAREARVATATQGSDALRYAVALHVGTVAYGNVGASNRLDFTVIGPAVNLASRLNALGKDLDSDIVLSQAFAENCHESMVSLGKHQLRGLAGEHEAFTLAE